MSYLQAVFEDEDVQNYVDSCEEELIEGTEYFHETPQMIKDYIFENLEDFVVPGDLEQTYLNIIKFVEGCVVDNLHEICDTIVEQTTD